MTGKERARASRKKSRPSSRQRRKEDGRRSKRRKTSFSGGKGRARRGTKSRKNVRGTRDGRGRRRDEYGLGNPFSRTTNSTNKNSASISQCHDLITVNKWLTLSVNDSGKEDINGLVEAARRDVGPTGKLFYTWTAIEITKLKNTIGTMTLYYLDPILKNYIPVTNGSIEVPNQQYEPDSYVFKIDENLNPVAVFTETHHKNDYEETMKTNMERRVKQEGQVSQKKGSEEEGLTSTVSRIMIDSSGREFEVRPAFEEGTKTMWKRCEEASSIENLTNIESYVKSYFSSFSNLICTNLKNTEGGVSVTLVVDVIRRLDGQQEERQRKVFDIPWSDTFLEVRTSLEEKVIPETFPLWIQSPIHGREFLAKRIELFGREYVIREFGMEAASFVWGGMFPEHENLRNGVKVLPSPELATGETTVSFTYPYANHGHPSSVFEVNVPPLSSQLEAYTLFKPLRDKFSTFMETMSKVRRLKEELKYMVLDEMYYLHSASVSMGLEEKEEAKKEWIQSILRKELSTEKMRGLLSIISSSIALGYNEQRELIGLDTWVSTLLSPERKKNILYGMCSNKIDSLRKMRAMNSYLVEDIDSGTMKKMTNKKELCSDEHVNKELTFSIALTREEFSEEQKLADMKEVARSYPLSYSLLYPPEGSRKEK